MKTKIVKKTVKNDNQNLQNIAKNVDAILKHAEQLNSYTKQYNWLVEKENELKKVHTNFLKFLSKNSKTTSENVFDDDSINSLDYKILIMNKRDNYSSDALVTIQKSEIVGAFSKKLLDFVVETKTELLIKINEFEKIHSKTFNK